MRIANKLSTLFICVVRPNPCKNVIAHFSITIIQNLSTKITNKTFAFNPMYHNYNIFNASSIIIDRDIFVLIKMQPKNIPFVVFAKNVSTFTIGNIPKSWLFFWWYYF